VRGHLPAAPFTMPLVLFSSQPLARRGGLLRSALLGALSLALLVTTTGCALSPGTSFSRYNPSPNPLRVLMGDAPDEAPIPPGALTRITPDLIKSLRSAAPAPVDPTVAIQPLLGAPQAYRIGVRDVVAISVWGHPEFGGGSGGASGSSGLNTYPVTQSGEIQFPYLGAVKVAGLTEAELQERLSKGLARFLREPLVGVKVQEFRAGRVFVDGEVRNPGAYPITDMPMTLPEALVRAGGIPQTADRTALTLTRNGTPTRINLDALTARGFDPERILLAPGDVLRVAPRVTEDAKVWVLGEVNAPRPQPLKNGRLTLYEALMESGGLASASADPRQVYVIRIPQPDKPEIFHLDVSNPIALALADGFDLRPRDVVYVDPVPLVRWNRVISLILPSAQAITVPREVVRQLQQ